jgi:hypothetical protein
MDVIKDGTNATYNYPEITPFCSYHRNHAYITHPDADNG